jgi:hypothetical protein
MSIAASRVWDEFVFMFEWKRGIAASCCGLCGNTGIIDTRGTAKTPDGRDAGIRAFCICPNGRTAKRKAGRRIWNMRELGDSLVEAPYKAEE